MKRTLHLLFIFFSIHSFAQGIVVDNTTLSVPQLVSTELMGSSCSNETNFVFSAHSGIGQFTNTNPGFPITSGIIIRNGDAKNTEGIYTGLNESSQTNTASDVDLQAISDANGQTAPITDVAFVQFDFTPLSSNFSFDFIFASNEYGQYQCRFSDVFAFLLTDLTTGTTTNLAVIPATTTPISVKSIRDSAYNPTCLSVNANLFSRYNVDNPAASAINMRGETVLLTASSPVTPNRTYRIILAIGDYQDSSFDSAVFIKGGSFVTTANLGPDQVICSGETIILNAGLGAGYTYSWTRNGTVIAGQVNATLPTTQAGTYGVTATNGGCVITDEIILTDLQTGTPTDLILCNSGQATYNFDLTQNDLATLGVDPAEYSIMYFATLANANANGPQIPAGQLSSYSSAGNQTIYIKLRHTTNGNAICSNLLSFNLVVSSSFNANNPPNLRFCDNSTGTVNVNLTSQNNAILGAQNPANFNITFFESQADAQASNNTIGSSYGMTIAQSPKTIWVRVESVANSNCFRIVSFTITIFPQPPVDSISDVVECSSYTLPPLTNGTYHTGPNGTGTTLQPGNVINTTGTYYIFNGPIAPNNCTNQSSFEVTFIDELTFQSTACGEYIIPEVPAGDFFTGNHGTGNVIPEGTALLTDQTIYFYAVFNGVVCRDETLPITVFPLPPVDNPDDVITCDTYTLPSITDGNYFTGSGGSGTALNAGDSITTTQNVYVFADDGRCTDENVIRINIVDTSLYQPVTSCGSFILPDVEVGSYYTQPQGGGTMFPPGTEITTSQTVYYYANTTTLPNCTDNLNYQITILPVLTIDSPSNRLECGSYTLPTLTNNGDYYTGSGGSGTQLNAGDVITTDQTIYIYAMNTNGCANENSFDVTIRPLPPVDDPLHVTVCGDYTLPPLVNGTYYSAPGGPNGSGFLINPGTVIRTSQTIYSYNEWPDFTACTNEFPLNIEILRVEVGTFDDVFACDSYTLPALLVGDYYSQPGGQGAIIPPGTVLNATQTLYVYDSVAGDRLTCTDEDEFLVTVSQTPVLVTPPDVAICGSYVLPPLVEGNYFSGTSGSGTPYFAGDTITTSLNMFIYATAPDNPNCLDQVFFYISVYPLHELHIDDSSICVDAVTGALLQSTELETGLDPANFSVDWFLGGVLVGTGTSYTATQEGDYSIIVTKNIPDVGNDCSYSNPTIVTVAQSSVAIANVTVTGAFENVIDIIVNVTGGFGTYEYQLDNGPFQSSNVFHNAPSGEHTITINDTKGNCGDITLPVKVLKYPNYFTPNADGSNDTWNIWDLNDQPNAVINIFDRYGKFIKQFSPVGPGWDGNYNGEPLPSTDYWFQVFYQNNNVDQEFRGHFSMKR